MRRNPTWILALIVVVAMLAGGWYALRPREQLTVLTLFKRNSSAVLLPVEEGIQLALEECGHRAGRYRLVVAAREIRPEFDVYLGADEAVQETLKNPNIVAVIGAWCMDIAGPLNRKGVLLVAPDERLSELTKPGFGSNYTPECYRPSGELNFFRVIPADDVVQRGCAEWARKRGAMTVFVFDPNVLRRERFPGLTRVGEEEDSEEDVLGRILSTRADVVYLTKEVAYAWESYLPEARCLGWDGTMVYDGDPAEELPSHVNLPEGMVAIHRAGPPADFVKKFAARYGRPGDRSAWYGYLAATTVVEAIDRARTKDRDEIRRICAQLPIFDANGDTLSNELQVSVVRNDILVPKERFTPGPRPPDPPKPKLTLSFSGTSQGFEDIQPLDDHEMRGTFYIDPTKIDTQGFMMKVTLDSMRRWGHEIVEVPPPLGLEGKGLSLDQLKAIVDRSLKDRKPVQILLDEEIDRKDLWELCKYINSKGFMVLPAREILGK